MFNSQCQKYTLNKTVVGIISITPVFELKQKSPAEKHKLRLILYQVMNGIQKQLPYQFDRDFIDLRYF